jgi:hypothetical protein
VLAKTTISRIMLLTVVVLLREEPRKACENVNEMLRVPAMAGRLDGFLVDIRGENLNAEVLLLPAISSYSIARCCGPRRQRSDHPDRRKSASSGHEAMPVRSFSNASRSRKKFVR